MDWSKHLSYYYGVSSIKQAIGCLSDLALKETKGRRFSSGNEQIPYEDMLLAEQINPFLFDLNKIVQSKGYRRLSDKTQVFINASNPHMSTRRKHTDEVMGCAMMMADLLGLNIFLTQAISALHDIGHGPYGHLCEMVYEEIFQESFSHELFGVVIAQHIERGGAGLNLSYEVLKGASSHSGGIKFFDDDTPAEYILVRLADKIAYTFGDINDIIRIGLLKRSDLPPVIQYFGESQRDAVSIMICDVVMESYKAGKLVYGKSQFWQMFSELRAWMFENIYHKADKKIHKMALVEAGELLKNFFGFVKAKNSFPLLTDREVQKLAIWKLESHEITIDDLRDFGVMEIYKSFEQTNHSWVNVHGNDLDLEWGKDRLPQPIAL